MRSSSRTTALRRYQKPRSAMTKQWVSSMTTEYVCVNPKSHQWAPGKVLLRRREKEPYQNQFNLVGGKLRLRETVEAAATRTLADITGHSLSGARVMGCKTGNDFCVWYLTGSVGREPTVSGVWFDTSDAIQNPFLVPDLKIILPLMDAGVSNWKLSENDSGVLAVEFLPCSTS